jgi:hypothetical protein
MNKRTIPRLFSLEEIEKHRASYVNKHSELTAALSSVGTPLPNLTSKAKSLLAAGINWTSKGFELASEEQLKYRMEICKSCPFWDPEGMMGTGKCNKCGCSTQAKLRMATEKCPIDKWLPIV